MDGASDHTTHEAIHLRDPDGNGIEPDWNGDPSY
jgi:catechol-2,3-dioxygenase